MKKSGARRSRERRLVVEQLEGRVMMSVAAFTATVPTTDSSRQFHAVPTASGFEAIGLSDSLTLTEFDHDGQVTGSVEFTPPPGHTTGFDRFSDDGQWIRGYSYDPGDPTPVAVYWKVDEPNRPLTELDVGSNLASGLFSVVLATGLESGDGRVIAAVPPVLPSPPTVTVDGVAHPILDATGSPITGNIDSLISGLGGDRRQWVAVGHADAPQSWNQFIAFSDGRAMPLYEFVQQQSNVGDALYVFDVSGGVSIAGDSILFVGKIWGSPSYPNPLVGSGVALFEGYSVTVLSLPIDVAYSPLDVNLDGHIAPDDLMAVVSALNGQADTSTTSNSYGRLDINRDGHIAPNDLLAIVSFLNTNAPTTLASLNGSAEGESVSQNSEVDALASQSDALGEVIVPHRRR